MKNVFSKTQTQLIIFLSILILAIFFRVYNLEARFPFGWDQARDAEMMWSIIKEHKLTLIGPQVVSDNAFFLGPLWFYLLLPFYLMFNMDPFASAVFVVVSGVVTTAALYSFTKKIFGIKQAVIASLIWASMFEVVAWNPMLIPLLVIVTLWSLIEVINGKKEFIILAYLLLGLGLQIHFQAIFLIIPLGFSIYIYYKNLKKLPIKELMYGKVLFLLTFLPLFIFDLRHNFINFYGALKLFEIGVSNPHNQISYLNQLIGVVPKFIQTTLFFLPAISNYKLIFGSIVLLCSLIGIYKMNIYWAKKGLFLSLIILPVILFSFYKGNLSEYYFALSFVPILLGFVSFLRMIFDFSIAGKIFVTSFLVWLIISNIGSILSKRELTGLYYQKKAVLYLKQQNIDQIINVSFDTPVNTDSAFKYLFKYYNLNPQNIPQGHLWTIVIPAKAQGDPKASFGDIGIIRR